MSLFVWVGHRQSVPLSSTSCGIRDECNPGSAGANPRISRMSRSLSLATRDSSGDPPNLQPPRRNTEEFVLQDGTQQQASRRPIGNGIKYVTFKKRRGMKMALTRDFRETVQADAKRDPAFRRGLLIDALESLLSGEVALGKELLRDYINATVGFPKLAAHTKIHAKTLHQMFGPNGNPTANNLF